MPVAITPYTLDFAGRRCLQLSNRHGTATIALQGGQLLSWVPVGHREVFWVSPQPLPQPAALRGGVPVCWPWFGKQGMPEGGMQHGPVRNRLWEVTTVNTDNPDRIGVSLTPTPAADPHDPLLRFAAGLQLELQLELGETLTQTLRTLNHGDHAVVQTQALHNYFAVHAADRVEVHGLDGLSFEDKLSATPGLVQQGALLLHGEACDRVYAQTPNSPGRHYTLADPLCHRRIQLTTQGSQSLVVWNPGAEAAAQMADVPPGGWRHFICVEAANAGDDRIILPPGGEHNLQQTLTVSHWNP